MLTSIEASLTAWLLPGASVLLALVATYAAYRVALALTRRFTRSKAVPRIFLDAAARALGVVLCLLVLNGVLETAPEGLPLLPELQHFATLLLILSLTWAAVRCTSAIGDVIVTLNPVLEGQWKRARKVETQTRFLVRGLNILIVIIGLGAALMTFEGVRHVGGSLRASAGIGGIVLGFAARPVLGNLLAGMQIALTQPFRIDDVLHVQGEWCWVEEVTATYVVLRVWDLRRLIVPLQWFIENPFQNWSRNTADMMGTVFLSLDYAMPVQPLREEFARLLRQSPQWDGKTETVQVTDSSERALQIRSLMSASNSSQAWDLRCAVREGLVAFVQNHYPEYLPRVRARLVDEPTAAPTRWTMMYLQNLFAHEWEQTRSPAGAIQWQPKDGAAANTVPDAHVKGKYHAPMMFTTDLSLKEDPAYRKIAMRFLENPDEFELAFAKAWFKLTHRDMGPQARYIGADVPDVALMWQDPIPEIDYESVDGEDVIELKKAILDSGLTTGELVRTAWASASTYRNTDMRGGANGARVRLEPQKNWPVNDPAELSKVLETLTSIQEEANGSLPGKKKVSMADLIVLGGAAAIEQAAKKAGYDVDVPFTPGRADATLEQTEVESFAVLEPTADGFRNYYGDGNRLPPTDLLVDRADLLGLTVPEMTALVGGLRVLDANAGGVKHGVFTDRPGTLSNDFFVNLLSMSLTWSKSEDSEGLYEVRDRSTGEVKWTATPVDLVFGSNAELRAVAEAYGSKGGEELLVHDFVDAWAKVMTADRFDLKRG